MNRLRQLLFFIFFIYLSLCATLFFFQQDLLYFPTSSYAHSYPTLKIQNKDEFIDVIVLNDGKKEAVIFFGGNGQSVIKSAKHKLQNFPEHTIYLVNYRGYGKSTGKPDEQGIYADALAVYDHVKKIHNNISIMGRSLGTGVATYVAVNKEIDKLILVTPYDSIENIAKSQYPFFPISILLTDKFDSVNRANQITAKTLVLLAENDEIIPLANSINLVKAFAADLVTVKMIKGKNHKTLSHMPEYDLVIQHFMKH